MTTKGAMTTKGDSEILERYFDGRLTTAEAADFELRLSADDALRAEWIERGKTRRRNKAVPSELVERGWRQGLEVASRPERSGFTGFLAAAAGLVLVAGLALFVSRTPSPSPGAVTRAVPGLAAVPELIEPIAGAPLEQVDSFRWTPVAGALEYRLVVLDLDGEIVGSSSTVGPCLGGTCDVARVDLELGAGTAYAWYVEARWADRQPTSSATRRLSTNSQRDPEPAPP